MLGFGTNIKIIIKNKNKNHIDKMPFKKDKKEQCDIIIKTISKTKYINEKIKLVDQTLNGINIIIIKQIKNNILLLASSL